jgi:uncharacterized protein (TIGR02246 family)
MTRVHKASMLLGAAALALTLGGCNDQKGAAGAADAGAAKDAIKADEKKWNDDFKAKNLEALAGHYADDTFFIAPGVKAADGATQVRKVYAEGLADKNFEVSFASDKIDAAASGDLAYARGHFSEKYTDFKTGQVMSHSGSYITVYKKQQDGSWKAVEDFAAVEPGTEKAVSTPVAKPAS